MEQKNDYIKYNDLLNFIKYNDLNIKDNYEKLKEILDIDNFIDYCSINIYIKNKDSGLNPSGNNMIIWQTKNKNNKKYRDGKWRFLLYDNDLNFFFR